METVVEYLWSGDLGQKESSLFKATRPLTLEIFKDLEINIFKMEENTYTWTKMEENNTYFWTKFGT